MPELQLQLARRLQNSKTPKLKWEGLEYKEMVALVEKLAGPRPEVPADITAEPWSEQAIRVLHERYFLKDKDGKIIETVEEMCWRVAWELARAEVKFGGTRKEIQTQAREFYKLMLDRRFLPNSPTLMNAGKNNGLQYSACYVLPVPDSLEGIFDGVKYQGLIHQSGGGCISGDARVWTTFCGIEPIGTLFARATGDGRIGVRQGSGIAYDVADLDIKTTSMDPETGKTGLKKVTHVWKYQVPEDQQVVVTTAEGTTVQTSSWHPFMVVRGIKIVEVEAGDLKTGDVILGPDKAGKYWPWKKYCKVGFLTVDQDLAWLIGFTLGDGSFGYVPALRQYRVRWFSGRGDVLQKAQTILAKFNIHVSIQRDRRGLLSIATLNQRFVHDLLEACGLEKFGPKDERIRIPEIIAKSPLSAVEAFVAGLLDSDGYVAPDGSPSFSTVSENMAQDLAALLSLLGYSPRVNSKEPYGKGKKRVYSVLLCNLPQVNELAKTISPYLSSEFRKERLKSSSRKQTSLPLSFHAFRDELAKLGLAKKRSDKVGGSGPLAGELNYWSAHGRINRDSLHSIAKAAAPLSPKLAKILLRVTDGGHEIKSVEQATIAKPYYDLSVEEWNTYAAGQSGMVMIHNTGFSFSRLRPKGSRVKTSMGVASGPVSFMKIYNEATQQIKQGGTRRGANMGILRVDHPDIMEFIHCKDDGKEITNFNISVAITDKFMKAFEEDGEYELVAPHTGKVTGKLRARDVWDEIAQSAWKTGDPGLVFIDRINQRTGNPVRAEGWEVESTNPCGEQPLYPFDACNLGSIFLSYFVKDGKIDWERLKETTCTAVRFLDNVIEMNPFPLPQIADTVRKIRRIGLGVGGWADMLVELGIPYDSDQALQLAGRVMKFVNEEGHKASQQLARERGAFPMWQKSIYAKDKPIRNSTVTTIAPTGSIGILANASGGIEPLFAIAYQHIVKSENRTLTFVNPGLERIARERGFYSEELMAKIAEHGVIRTLSEIPEEVRAVFGTAHEIDQVWHVKTQAAFQKYTDNSVSKTINLPNRATVEDVKRAYMLAWETGCNGITVFRDGSKSEQVLNLGTNNSVQSQLIKPRPVKVEGATYKIETPLGGAFVTVNHDGEGNPFEVFVTIGKAGSEVAAMAEALGRLISTTLRFGNHLPAKERAREIMEQLQGIGGGTAVGFGPNKIRSLPDAVARAIGMHFGLLGHQEVPNNVQTSIFQNGQANGLIKKADLCPNCGNGGLVFEEGCKKCYGCGYSEC